MIYLFYIIYFSIRQLIFNFHVNLNSKPFRWKVHKKTTQALVSEMMIVIGISCLADRSGISLILFGILFDVIMFSDLLYMRYYKNPLTCSVILHNITVLKDIKKSVNSVFIKKDLFYFIDIPFLLLLTIWFYKLTQNRIINLRFGIIFVVSGVVWLFVIYYLSNREPYKWNKKRIARDLGILFFHLNDICRTCIKILHKKKISKDEIQLIKKQFNRVKKNQFSDICKEKNVIVVQMESMQNYLIDMDIGGVAVTPNLRKLMNENIRFENMYYQTSVANTSDAELLCNNSLYPSEDKVSCYEYEKNRFYALGERMAEAGYITKAYHGNQASFWNRSQVYNQYGYHKFIDDSDMDRSSICGMGISDSSLFKQFIEMEIRKMKNQKSFYFIITLSQHHPFDEFEKYNFSVGQYEGTIFGNYLKAAHYADCAIGEFINGLKEEGIYNNCLLFMYGDHAGLPDEYYFQNEHKFKKAYDINWVREQKVAAVLHLPDDVKNNLGKLYPRKVDKITGQIDILPTLCNLLGLNDDFLLGEDMFDFSNDGIAILRDGTVIGKNMIYFEGDSKVYSKEGVKRKMSQSEEKQIEKAKERLKSSDFILENNVIKIEKSYININNIYT